jgi:hypothetical protein
MVFNITVLRKLQQANVDLFEIVKNNNTYLLNSFHRMIVDCINAINTAEPEYLDMFQNIKNQWGNIREEYILRMVQEYQHELSAYCAYDIREHIKYLTTDQILNQMFSDERMKLPWLDSGEYYQRLLEIQTGCIKYFPSTK